MRFSADIYGVQYVTMSQVPPDIRRIHKEIKSSEFTKYYDVFFKLNKFNFVVVVIECLDENW